MEGRCKRTHFPQQQQQQQQEQQQQQQQRQRQAQRAAPSRRSGRSSLGFLQNSYYLILVPECLCWYL